MSGGFTEDEIRALEAELSRPDNVIHGRGPKFLRRLLATIHARDEEITRLREERDAAKASALAMHHIAFRQA